MEVTTLTSSPTTTTTSLFSISKTLHFPQLPQRLSTTVFGRLPSSGCKYKLGLKWCRLECVSTSGGDEGIGGVNDDDVIILNVGGMTCGGCSASVKRILENQAQVSSASVDHTTDTAIVWLVPEAKAIPNWQKVMGEELAKHVTTCGFSSTLRGEAATEG